MTSRTNPKVDWYFEKERTWKAEVTELRKYMLNSGLVEELKWGCPCYTLDGTNVVLIHAFKNYCAILFMKGVLLNDPDNILIQQTEHVQSARQIRFTSLELIKGMEQAIKAYVSDAIRVERTGLKVEFKKTEEFAMPDELRGKFEEMPMLREAFEGLTPGRQRGYKLYFSSAKQSKTRLERVEKNIDRILDGLGLDD